MSTQGELHLAKLDTVTGYLYLIVRSPQKLNVSVWQQSPQITCPVDPLLPRVTGEFKLGQSFILVILLRQSRATYHDFTDFTRSEWLE